MLYCVASLKPFRRGSLRHDREMRFLTEWLETVRRAANTDILLAIGLARLRNLVKGYGDTYERGRLKYQTICSSVSENTGGPSAATHLQALIAAAEKDENGVALRAAIDKLSGTRRSETADIGV